MLWEILSVLHLIALNLYVNGELRNDVADFNLQQVVSSFRSLLDEVWEAYSQSE
jgi:hypothetical protein